MKRFEERKKKKYINWLMPYQDVEMKYFWCFVNVDGDVQSRKFRVEWILIFGHGFF